MKNTFYFLPLICVLLKMPVLAQTNYVGTSPASATPGSDNTLVGVGAGNLNMSGASNLFIGRGSGIQNMAGTKNAFLGASSGNQNTSGQNNSFVGYNSGYSNSSGNSNTFLGAEAGYTNGVGYSNVFSGYRAGYFNNQGNNNAFFGTGTGYSNTQGSDNTFIGTDAGSGSTTGSGNTFLGSLTGASNGGGSLNTFIGKSAGTSSTGNFNTFLGAQAGYSSTSGAGNVFIGYQTGYSSTTSGSNVFLGFSAGYFNTSGVANVLIGTTAGYYNTTGQANMFLGTQAGFHNTTGSSNVFVGSASGSGTTTGLGNTAIGDGTLLANTSGIRTTAIGQYAGVYTTGDYNTFIGFAADVTPGTPNLTNVVAIGANTLVSQSNSIVLGNGSNVGIGTSAPNAKLEVVSGNTGVSGLRLTSLGTTATLLNQTKFLTVNASGDVVLGSLNGSARVGADAESSWQLAGDNLQNTNVGGVIIGSGISKTPAGYRLYVSDGVLTEKVKVAVKSTSDWSDRVFEKGYRLRGLAEVEQYINQEKHLPGVPSADEVVKEGVDVGKMQAKLLEKVEELTLYVIELKKQNEALKQKSLYLEKRVNKIHRNLKSQR